MLTLSVPSDRDWDTPDVGVGIDTVAVMVPSTERLLVSLPLQRSERTLDLDTGELTEFSRGCSHSVHVGLGVTRLHGMHLKGEPWLRLELSLPTMMSGHNVQPLSRFLLADALDAATTDLTRQGIEITGLSAAKVQRVDLSRDFHGVRSPGATLDVFSRRHVRHARLHHVHHDPVHGVPQTVTKGNTREYVVRGYDKACEMLARSERCRSDRHRRAAFRECADACQGQLRYELELRAPLLRRKGIMTVDDLIPERLDDLARDYFARVRWNDPYGGTTAHAATLQELRGQLTDAEFRNLLAFLYAEQTGLDDVLGRHPYEKIRPIVRRYNLLDAAADGPVRRLDFEAGHEIDHLPPVSSGNE